MNEPEEKKEEEKKEPQPTLGVSVSEDIGLAEKSGNA